MVSVFPDLLAYSLLAPFVLRVVCVVIFLKFASLHGRRARTNNGATQATGEVVPEMKPRWSGFLLWCLCILEVSIAFLLFIGLFVQVAALFGFFIALALFFRRKKSPTLAPYSGMLYLLLASVCLSLLLSGAGRPGFDLPL